MHIPILKRVGAVSIAVGLLGLLLTAKYGSGVWLFTFGLDALPLVAGIFLWRGSLRAARLVRAAMALGLGAIVMGLVGLPFLQPAELSLTEIRLDPAGFLWPAVIVIVAICVEVWIMRELDREPVRLASASAGLRRWDTSTPAKAGAAAIFLAIALQWLALHGKSAAAAASLAQDQLGFGYRYALTSISSTSKDGRTSVSGVVTAWNDNEIKKVLLHWTEQ
jgi:hypothetical protein